MSVQMAYRAAVLGAMGALMWKVNDRASRVEMPATGQHLRHLPQCKLDLKKAAHLLSEMRCFVLL